METLDVTGLPINKVEELKRFIERWRGEEIAEDETEITQEGNDLDEDIVFASYKSNMFGRLTRREMYEDKS
tara:strand:+ start:304 stop:516 length:213 start_codon:yes stop_codon:yes gene_type:complete